MNKNSYVIMITYLYLLIPFLIFAWGYFDTLFAIIATIVSLISIYFACLNIIKDNSETSFFPNKFMVVGIVILAEVWVYFSGLGGFVYQNTDHLWRNTVLQILVEDSWPVTITETAPHYDQPVALVYYFAFWLPAAVFGKLFGLQAAHVFLMLWAVVGVVLTFCLIIQYTKQEKYWPIILFIFFSGADMVGQFVSAIMHGNVAEYSIFNTIHLEWWAGVFQYSSFTTQLFWVFNQAIPAWLITLLLLLCKDNKSIIFVYSLGVLACPIPALGMIPLLLYLVVSRTKMIIENGKFTRKKFRNFFVEHFTFQNFFGGGLIGITSFLFLKINLSSANAGSLDITSGFVLRYICFILIETIPFAVLLYKNSHQSSLYWLAFICLLIIPFIQIGYSYDFCMRASIPYLLILYLFVVETLVQSKSALHINQNKIIFCMLFLLLVIGTITPLHEFGRAIMNTMNGVTYAGELMYLEMGSNFLGHYEGSIFFEYIAK